LSENVPHPAKRVVIVPTITRIEKKDYIPKELFNTRLIQLYSLFEVKNNQNLFDIHIKQFIFEKWAQLDETRTTFPMIFKRETI
jgi:hypothetical protein